MSSLQQCGEVEEEGSRAGWHLGMDPMHDQLIICSQVKAKVYEGEDYVK